jgi:hypothetical protein
MPVGILRRLPVRYRGLTTACAVLLIALGVNAQRAHGAAPFYEGKQSGLSLEHRQVAGTIPTHASLRAISAIIFPASLPSSLITCRERADWFRRTISSRWPNPTVSPWAISLLWMITAFIPIPSR